MAVGPESESNMMEELSAMGTSQKSFYDKAFAEMTYNGIVIYSYNTPVLRWDGEKLHRLWGGWSATTQRHINAMLWQMVRRDGKPFLTMTKRVWESMPVEEK